MAFWLVAGVVGRDTCWAQAARADDLTSLRALAALARIFERAMVRPATFTVLLTGLVAAWMRGWPILDSSAARRHRGSRGRHGSSVRAAGDCRARVADDREAILRATFA